ncbi:hypothetical protein EI005_25795 [Escherichia coli]|nr:hypothetical protein [Escherichia coli]
MKEQDEPQDDRSHTDPKRTQMPAQATIPNKTINHHRWRNKIFHDKTKFTQYLSTNPALQRIIDGKQQTQKKIATQT